MTSDTQKLETCFLDDCHSVAAECQDEYERANQYIARIGELIEVQSSQLASRHDLAHQPLQAYLPALSRLKEDLSAAIEKNIETTLESDESSQTCGSSPSIPFEQALLKTADICWLCNQCDYYFAAASSPVTAQQQPHKRRQWQIRSARRAKRYLKIVDVIRRQLFQKSSQ